MAVGNASATKRQLYELQQISQHSKFRQEQKLECIQAQELGVQAKGAAETLKLNMALILVPVCHNMLTWIRSTRARLFIPFDENINFHKASIFGNFGTRRDNYLSVHIRIVGDWTEELKRVFAEDVGSACVIGRAKFGQLGNMDQRGLPKLFVDGPYGAPAQDNRNYDVLLIVGLGIGATPFISILRDLLNNTRTEDQMNSNTETSISNASLNSYTSLTSSSEKKKSQRTKNMNFYWVTREPGSFEWFKGVMNEVAEMDHKGQIEMHNYLTSVYEEGDARSTLITMDQALNHAKHGVDILSGTRVRTHFARPNWKEVFNKSASKYPYATVGVFYCGMPLLAKELRKLSHELTHRTSTRFEFHEYSEVKGLPPKHQAAILFVIL
ncbi:riboflavin synthase-like superfamily protein [Actinidia rufa]|uniref:Riboflavin synthase-like superfamily protein n=1 Tax=Actinidia rufa TaxID=165716 RepID=A0A7J0DMN4_9ERIC|nr:riboflavin synthase-like superfamily protein [Actinidia rufa]